MKFSGYLSTGALLVIIGISGCVISGCDSSSNSTKTTDSETATFPASSTDMGNGTGSDPNVNPGTDSEEDTQTNADSETGALEDTQTNADSDTGILEDTQTNADSDTGILEDTQTNADSDTGTLEDTGSGIDTDSETINDADTGIGTDSETVTDADTGISTDSETVTDADTGISTDSETVTDADTGIGTDTETETVADTGDDNPMEGIWVSRCPGSYFTFDVFELKDNTFFESCSNLSMVDHYSGTIDSQDAAQQQLFCSGTQLSDNTPISQYCSYADTTSPVSFYCTEDDYVTPSGGIEGIDFVTYQKVDASQCRRYVASADLEMDGETGTALCGFSADMLAHYCTFKSESTEFTVTNGYTDFDAFLNESLLPGKRAYAFEQHPGGYEVPSYNAEGVLTSANGSGDYIVTYDSWDSKGRPLTGTMVFSPGIDCSDTPVVLSYNDATRTVTEEQQYQNATGAACLDDARTTVETFDETGFLVSRLEYDGVTLTSATTTSNPQMGIACAYEACPNAATLPSTLSQTYDMTVTGDWEGTMEITFENGAATLANISLHMTSGSYSFNRSEPWTAFCIKDFGEHLVFAFEDKILTNPPGTDIQQVIHLALPKAELGQNTLAGTYNHGSWISGTHIGNVSLVAQ